MEYKYNDVLFFYIAAKTFYLFFHFLTATKAIYEEVLKISISKTKKYEYDTCSQSNCKFSEISTTNPKTKKKQLEM